MRTVLAFVAAALAPVCLIVLVYLFGQFSIFPANDPSIWVRTRTVLVMCLVLSALHVFLLGVPAYALLRWRNAIHWWTTVSAGFVLAAVPIAVFSWPLKYSDLKASAVINGVQTLVDGVPTTAGWMQYVEGVASIGGLGALSGLAFWLVWRPKGARAAFNGGMV